MSATGCFSLSSLIASSLPASKPGDGGMAFFGLPTLLLLLPKAFPPLALRGGAVNVLQGTAVASAASLLELTFGVPLWGDWLAFRVTLGLLAPCFSEMSVGDLPRALEPCRESGGFNDMSVGSGARLDPSLGPGVNLSRCNCGFGELLFGEAEGLLSLAATLLRVDTLFLMPSGSTGFSSTCADPNLSVGFFLKPLFCDGRESR
mmetsp:Transcript_99140/g.175709  ORF Transcript_99140/g.175709 Transcript_99140/m.175709 type:complete len:204 (+) Transcript_99140:3844-4455(+)